MITRRAVLESKNAMLDFRNDKSILYATYELQVFGEVGTTRGHQHSNTGVQEEKT